MRKLFDKTKITEDLLRSTKADDSEMMLFPDATVKMSSLLPDDQYVAIMIEY